MKSVTTCCFLSSLFFSFADAKCGESSATPSNIISQSEDKFRIDASKFCESRGARIEDSDQGQYVGFLDPNDWIAYDIELPSAGSYQITYSVASLQGKGSFQLEKLGGSAVYGIVSTVPTTGSWYAFENVAHTVQLPKGKQAIALAIQEGDFNIDWIELKRLASDSKETPVPSSVDAPVSSPIAEQPSAAPAVVVKTPTPIPVTSPMPVPVAAPIKTPRAAVPSTGSGFVRAIDKRIVDGKGNNLILRGQGLGGWMLQEPYQMLTVEAAPKGQWQMFQKIEETVGRAGLEQYRQAWLDNWCTQEDVKEFKASGFNSIRVALHYNLFTLPIEQEPVRGQDTWIQDGFDRLDLLLDWCQMEEIYLILDLHAAPGGQGANSAINDYDDSKPSMWEDEENVRKSIALWVKWAAKYKDNTWIAGYDLLNEPNWGFEPGHPNGCSDQKNIPLKRFYDHAIAAIRKVDTNHIIYINGNCWGNNHKGIWPFADDNVALSFHRYWIENTDASIQNFLDMRDDYNVPIWMGESGENDNIWYKEAVQLLERHNIGWAWWTWKKLQSSSGSYSISPPDQYQTLIDYWAYGGPKPTNAIDILMELAENSLLENSIRNDEAIVALTGRRHSCADPPTINVLNSGSTRLDAKDYCNMMGIVTKMTVDVDGAGSNAGWLDEGVWIAYNINVVNAGAFRVNYRVSSKDGGGAFRISLFDTDGEVVGAIPSLPATGNWQSWATISDHITLPAGKCVLVITSEAAGWNISSLELSRKA